MNAATEPEELLPHPPVTERQRRQGLFFLTAAAAGVGFAMTLQMGLNANFVAQTMNLSGQQAGILEAFRETCGITAFWFLVVLSAFSEPLIAAAMLVLLSVGLSAYAVVPDYTWLILASLVWSQGLHMWMPLPNSMTLALAEPGQAGRRLGALSAAGAAGSAAGLLVAYLLHHRWGVSIRPLWFLAGGAALVAALACLFIPRDLKAPGPRMIIRRKYLLYYLLCFLEGWRKQIFLAFAGFLLTKEYGTPLSTMLLLWLSTQVLGWFISPLVGRIVDRVGERAVLTVYYLSMSVVFCGYIIFKQPEVLYVLFVVDSAFFACTIALTTYVNRIAPKSEHTPTLSFGIAMNHVAAVSMPLLGGFLWNRLGYQWTFAVGSIAAIISVVAVQWVPGRTPPLEKTAPPALETV